MANPNPTFLPMQNSTSGKLLIVGLLILICLAPTFFVFILLSERTTRSEEVQSEIIDKWGSNQVIAGPILSLPYIKTTLDSQGAGREISGVLNLLPDRMAYIAVVEPEVRSRSIFDAVVYKTKIEGQGSFATPDMSHTNVTPDQIQWDKAYIAIGITDTRGITQQADLKWNGASIVFEPGPKNSLVGNGGMHAFVPFSDASKQAFDFSYAFEIHGSEALEFLPLGSETNVSMKSNWKSPSFIGAYLPTERAVADGFSAEWLVSSFGRAYPQQWMDAEIKPEALLDSRFGVSFIQSVDFYRQIERAIKYAVMFISITFVAFFLFEILSGLRIHPFQYLLVGFALALFYLLLLSLSERLGFLLAYAISALATAGLITSYSASILKASKKALIIAGLLLLLYAYLYIIIQLEDLALLYGSMLLFVLLALIMYLTRNINWYRMDTRPK